MSTSLATFPAPMRPAERRPAFHDRREPSIMLEHALILGQLHYAGGAVPASRIGAGALKDLRALAARGWAELRPEAGERPAVWALTEAGRVAWGQTGGERPVILPDAPRATGPRFDPILDAMHGAEAHHA